MGIDYTFRNSINNCININNQDKNVNNNPPEDMERKRRKNNLKLQQHISDLENTVIINQECINKMIPTLLLQPSEKNKLISNLSKISKFFHEKKKLRKKIGEINSKMLINKQIIEEIKRRRDEGYLMYKDQMTYLSESVTKKTVLVKQFQKKFSEVEIFIQRECRTEEHIEKYGKWKTFTVIPFMKKNEDILKKKCFYEMQVNNQEKYLENLETENKILKENIENDKNQNNNEINEGNNKMEEIKKYYDNKTALQKKEIELMKCRLDIISERNFKKVVIPTFKSKNPISNLDININLFEPQKEEIQSENVKNEEEEGEGEGKEVIPPINEDWLDPEKKENISDIEKEQ